MHSQNAKGLKNILAGAAVAAVFAGVPAFVEAGKPPKPPPPPPPPVFPAPVPLNNEFFSWYETGATPPPPNYIGTPFLTDANAAAVHAYLSSLPSGAVRAVKVENPGISNATANLIFNSTSYNVSYVFGDLEGANAQQMATVLANQVRWLNGVVGGTATQSSLAYIGNYGFSAQARNLQAPTGYSFQGQHSFSAYQYNSYTAAGLNLSTPELYPGSPSYRNLAAGDSAHGTGFAPNIRSSLFVLPAWRIGNVIDGLEKNGLTDHKIIPWLANFNNWNNIGLDNDRNAANGFLFVPGAPMASFTDPSTGKVYPAMTAAQTADQMLSRRDFAALVTHVRMRGADSFHLLDSGITTVTRQEMEQDAVIGWMGEGSISQIFDQADHRMLIGQEPAPKEYGPGGDFSGGSDIIVDGQKLNVDQAGAIFSGVYSLSLKKLNVLISNMDDVDKTITLPSSIGGFALDSKDFVVTGGTHLLVEYALGGQGKKGNKWVFAGQHVPYTALSNDRSGFGIPEPGTLTLLAVATVFGMHRRRPRTQG